MSYRATVTKCDEGYVVDCPELNLTVKDPRRDDAVATFKKTLELVAESLSRPASLYVLDKLNQFIFIYGADWRSQNNLDAVAHIRSHPAFK